MIAADLLSDGLVPLRTSDTGEEALNIMNEFYVRHLPIVNNTQLLGLISEDDILEHDVLEAVGSYDLSLRFPPIQEMDHIYEVMRRMGDYHLTVIPVVDENEDYKGMITMEDLLHYFAQIGSFTEPGSIIVLELSRRDYSLSEISRIVESENAAILSSFVTTSLDKTAVMIDVTLKINRQNIQSILATFARFDYTVKATFYEREMYDALKERFDSLMSYLNI